MKKFKLLAMVGICGIALAACGGEETTSNETANSQESTAIESSVVEEKTVDSEVGKRSNPYKTGDKIEMNVTYYDDNSESYEGLLNVTVNSVMLGQEAQDFLMSENEYNDEAPEGYQWAVLNTTAELIEGSEDYQLSLLLTEEVFDPSGSSVDQTQVMAFSNNQLSDQSIFPGASATGDITLLVPTELDGTLMQLSYLGGGDTVWLSFN